MKIECVVDSANLVGESPVWSTAQQCLWWVDVRGATLHCLNADGRRDWQMPDFTPCLALCRSGRLIVALGGKLAFWHPNTEQAEFFAAPEPQLPGNRFNDGGCDRHGRLWISTMINNFGSDGSNIPIDRPHGSLYCISPDLTIRRVVEGMWIPNTVVWSPDDKTFYLGDSIINEIHAYDFDVAAGELSGRRLFAKNADPGHLDGSAVDEEGFIWNTHWGAGKLVRYSPDGRIDREITFPVPAPSSCAFGGKNMDTLYVTTARETLSVAQLAEYPLSGGLFMLQPGVRGLPEPVFAD